MSKDRKKEIVSGLVPMRNNNISLTRSSKQPNAIPHQTIISIEMNEFISKIEDILTQLSELEGKYDFSLADKYQGNAFPTQMELAAKMENLVHQITHEMGSTIAFLKEDIIELHRYIEFRKKYAILSDCELLFLIDDIGGNLNIKKCINDKAISLNWLDMRQAILKDWKSDFGNVSFEK